MVDKRHGTSGVARKKYRSRYGTHLGGAVRRHAPLGKVRNLESRKWHLQRFESDNMSLDKV